jgi:CCR4-NOT transcription complex subunit 1
MTLAKNKPILQRRLDLKELVFWAYETGKLIAICSFVVKIVEGCKESVVFRPPNPWLIAVLGVLRDIYEVVDLKMNIKFEVQVLCKNINIRIEEIPRLNSLASLTAPAKDGRNPDERVKAMILQALGRPASAEDLAGSREFLLELAAEHSIPPHDLRSSERVWKDFAQSLFCLKEFIYVD